LQKITGIPYYRLKGKEYLETGQEKRTWQTIHVTLINNSRLIEPCWLGIDNIETRYLKSKLHREKEGKTRKRNTKAQGTAGKQRSSRSYSHRRT